jgi:hypothetical protein
VVVVDAIEELLAKTSNTSVVGQGRWQFCNGKRDVCAKKVLKPEAFPQQFPTFFHWPFLFFGSHNIFTFSFNF